MAKKPQKVTKITGDINVTNGDVVAGDKTVIHGDDKDINEAGRSFSIKRHQNQTIMDQDGNINSNGGDVVFGDKVIQFFQESLHLYFFKDLKQLAFFLLFTLLVVSGISSGIWYANQPRKMAGTFNIAVAQFGEISENGEIKPSAHAEKISSTLFNYLDSEYRASGLGLTVQVSHKNMPLIIEDAQAEALANEVNADIVIYGNIYVSGDQAEFTPRFYVSEHPDTRELTGQNELALPIPFTVSELKSQDQVNAEFRARTEVLLAFTKALVYFSQDDMDSAGNAVQAAIIASEQTSQSFAGKEVIYLLESKVHLEQNKIELANESLDQALTINPKYARAYLARGNILYSHALELNFDSELLDKALEQYELAFSMPNQPEGAYIPIKAHTSIGNVLVVKAQQLNNSDVFSMAIENYEYVTNSYERTKDPFLRSYASIAYFGLGAAYERQGNKEQAIRAYEQAYGLTEDEEFKKRIQQQLELVQNQ